MLYYLPMFPDIATPHLVERSVQTRQCIQIGPGSLPVAVLHPDHAEGASWDLIEPDPTSVSLLLQFESTNPWLHVVPFAFEDALPTYYDQTVDWIVIANLFGAKHREQTIYKNSGLMTILAEECRRVLKWGSGVLTVVETTEPIPYAKISSPFLRAGFNWHIITDPDEFYKYTPTYYSGSYIAEFW